MSALIVVVNLSSSKQAAADEAGLTHAQAPARLLTYILEVISDEKPKSVLPSDFHGETGHSLVKECKSVGFVEDYFSIQAEGQSGTCVGAVGGDCSLRPGRSSEIILARKLRSTLLGSSSTSCIYQCDHCLTAPGVLGFVLWGLCLATSLMREGKRERRRGGSASAHRLHMLDWRSAKVLICNTLNEALLPSMLIHAHG